MEIECLGECGNFFFLDEEEKNKLIYCECGYVFELEKEKGFLKSKLIAINTGK